MKYKKFEDVPVWEKTRIFIISIYNLKTLNNKLSKDFSLRDQFRRASVSILLNISEGFERSSNKEFANYLNIAKGSAGEVRAILYIKRSKIYKY